MQLLGAQARGTGDCGQAPEQPLFSSRPSGGGLSSLDQSASQWSSLSSLLIPAARWTRGQPRASGVWASQAPLQRRLAAWLLRAVGVLPPCDAAAAPSAGRCRRGRTRPPSASRARLCGTQGGSELGQLALRRLVSAPGHASGCPTLRPASANQPLEPRRPATSGLLSTWVLARTGGGLEH